MKGFPPFKGVKLDKKIISKIKSHFRWSMFFVGESITSLTPSGGIHYSGKSTKTPAIAWEVRRGGRYWMCELFQYPKGLILHMHVFLPDAQGISPMDVTAVKLYSEVKNILEVRS